MKLISTKKIILSKKTWKEYEDNLFKKTGYEDQELSKLKSKFQIAHATALR